MYRGTVGSGLTQADRVKSLKNRDLARREVQLVAEGGAMTAKDRHRRRMMRRRDWLTKGSPLVLCAIAQSLLCT